MVQIFAVRFKIEANRVFYSQSTTVLFVSGSLWKIMGFKQKPRGAEIRKTEGRNSKK